ncbi:kinase-like domain-containing protein [Dactylonectria macrodidyma]|uniref:mitogen-activated protein kinase kinase n=1 Tax=Dactylonectria macrodidyma TaxID=307937 RepID=A0A9P9E2G0_9HYPO|nr:kinase-like domain-containing protein [Dactylonectria macrodidyma]
MAAAKPAGLESRISDLVVESRIEAAWDPEAEQTTQIRTAVGVSARRRRLKSEETWKRKRILGRGAYGTVWLEECIASSGPRHGESDLRAIKEIHKRPHVSTSEFHRELEAIAKFSHDRFAHCFVRSLGWFQNDESLFITMEYLKYGDLQQYLTNPFPEPEARQISLQVVEALQLMHESGFAHRDLKPGNILVFQKGPAWWVKIADFGISKRGVEASTVLRTMEIGTRGFMAPEILGLYCPDDFDEEAFEADEAAHDALAYTPVVDLWALGEITHRMLTQKPAFETRGRLWSYVTKGTAFPASELQAVGTSAQGISFIQEAMAASPRKRLTAVTAMSHDWLENHEFLDETRSRSSAER